MYFKSSTHMVLNLLVPNGANVKFTKLDMPFIPTKRDAMTSIPYAQAIGNLLFLATNTRLDLAHPIHHLA